MNAPIFKLMPPQKVPDSKKVDFEWQKQCVDAAESMVLLQNQYTRTTRYNKQVNYDLYNGLLHPSDVEKLMNPTGIKNVTFPAKPKNYPITNPYIKILIGEEMKRRFDYHLKVENEDAISEKEKAKKEEINSRLDSILKQGLEQDATEEELKKKLEQLQEYANYGWQDMRELAGTRLLDYYVNLLDFKNIASRAYEDSLISGEELYDIDIIANEPTLRKMNPLNTYFLMSPDSYKVEESDMIVEELYWPLSKVIDTYYEYLTPENIDYLEIRTGFKSNAGYGGPVNYELQDPVFAMPLGATQGIDINSLNTGAYSYAPFDNQNNIRVVRTRWRSMRRIGILTYFDETGNKVERPVHENWKIDKAAGEEIRYIWIGEWWEGTKIANEIYVKIQPRFIQFRKLNNLSECSSGVIGTVLKTNSSIPQSLFDIMKPYQYEYNLLMYRMELAVLRNKGKIPNMDYAKVPDGWSTDKWMFYLEIMGFNVTDSFKEAKKGAATGKIAGNMSGHNDVMDLDNSQYIASHVTLLQYIESQLDKITGISPQRRGQMSAEQGLGVTQESRQASATITEWYFKMHDNTKMRVLAALLETAKYCLRNKNKKIQYIEDDATTQIFEIDGEIINEAELGILLHDSSSDTQVLASLQRATETAVQTGQVDLIQMLDIFSNTSLASKRRKIEKSVKEKEAQRQQEVAEQNKTAQQGIEAKLQSEQENRALKKYEIDANNQTKLAIAEIAVYNRKEEVDFDQDAIPDPIEIAKQALAEQEHISAQFIEQQKHSHEQVKLQADKEKHDKTIALEEKKLAAHKAIEQLKSETAIKIAKTNKNKYDKPKSK